MTVEVECTRVEVLQGAQHTHKHSHQHGVERVGDPATNGLASGVFWHFLRRACTRTFVRPTNPAVSGRHLGRPGFRRNLTAVFPPILQKVMLDGTRVIRDSEMFRIQNLLTHVVAEREKLTGNRDLGGVRGHRHRFGPQEFRHVLFHRNGVRRRYRRHLRCRAEPREVKPWSLRIERVSGNLRRHLGMYDRRRASPQTSQRFMRCFMASHMVWVAIAATWPIRHHQVWAHVTDRRTHIIRDLGNGGTAQRLGGHVRRCNRVPVGSPLHAGILKPPR